MANNDDFDDFNEDDFLTDAESSQKSGMTGAWESKPGFRIFIILAIVLVGGVGAYAFFGGGDPAAQNNERSQIAAPSQQTIQSYDQEQQSPEQLARTQSNDVARANEAAASSRTELSTPILQNVAQEEALSLIDESLDAKGMQVWTQSDFKSENIKEPYQEAVEVQKVLETPPPVPTQPEPVVVSEPEIIQQPQPIPQPTINVQEVATRAELMQEQMRALISAWQPTEASRLGVVSVVRIPQPAAAGGEGEGDEATRGDLLLPAGDMIFAHMVTEANSDIPSPIVAEIIQGPARKARLIGSFSTANDYLILEFNQMILDGEEYTISAIALDPSTTLAGLATEIDQRYFRRVILPAAAEFVVGIGDAIADSQTSVEVNGNTTTTTTEGFDTAESIAQGAAEAASVVSDILTDEANEVQPLIRVEVGTPIGIMFLEGVYEGDSDG